MAGITTVTTQTETDYWSRLTGWAMVHENSEVQILPLAERYF